MTNNHFNEIVVRWVDLIWFHMIYSKCDFIPPKRMTHLKSHKYGEFVQYLIHNKNDSYILQQILIHSNSGLNQRQWGVNLQN